MPTGDLLELIVCTECKTRVEYHEERDGYMSCECWIRSTADDPMPDKWIEIEDRKINECGGCRANIPERSVFRCADCGLPFHQTCLDQHCKHGNQKQELRSENLFLKSQLAEKEGQLCAAGKLRLKRNVLIRDDKGFAGNWVAVPEEDFDALHAALTSSSPCRHEARVKELESSDDTWRAKKAMLENDLGKAWEENKRLRSIAARAEDVKKLRVVIKHNTWVITSHDDPFILYQQGNMSKGKLCEYIANAVAAYLKGEK